MHTVEALFHLYTTFEKERVEKANRQLGRNDIKADAFAKFIVDRTDLCPHKIISMNTAYWVDTVSLFDGEHGLSLPCDLDAIPGIFFDALALVRSGRASVRKEETKA